MSKQAKKPAVTKTPAKGKGGKVDPKKLPEKPKTPEPSDKEVLLKAELEAINQELETAKSRVIQLRHDNEWLQEETRKVRLENHEYMAYMEKKASKRQTAIISLSDQYQKQLEDLKKEKEVMMDDFEKKKEGLTAELMEKENTLAKINRELEELHEYKVLQQEQTATIKDLEKQIIVLRSKHSETIQAMKAKFLAEKQEYETTSQLKIADMTKQANRDAAICLNEHTENVKQQNRQLRKELLLLIRKSQALHENKHRLEEQRHELMMERQYADDMRNIRANRQLPKAIEAGATAAVGIKSKEERKLSSDSRRSNVAVADARAKGERKLSSDLKRPSSSGRSSEALTDTKVKGERKQSSDSKRSVATLT